MQIENLEQRSELLRTVRQFFYDRDFLEVETPLLSEEIIPELHIEPILTSRVATHRRREHQYLQSSPELHMKRLVAAKMQAIFQITRSFRADERGPLHSPEFTILEWYRTGDDLQAGMQLLDELCQATLATPPRQANHPRCRLRATRRHLPPHVDRRATRRAHASTKTARA